jgi:NADH dehydrogenase/NADH:ubiquinone oxidoreductase subunit G
MSLIPLPWRIAAFALMLAGLAAAGGLFVSHERDIGRNEVRAEWAKEKAAQLAQANREAESNAKETQRRLERQGDAQREYDAQLAQAQHDAAAATAALDGLRRRAAQYAAAARGAASHPAAVGNGPATDDPSGVLADVLGKLGGRAQLLAAYADAARRAGKQCERDYDTLRDAK